MVSGVLVAELMTGAAVVARKHFRRVGESGVDFVYNLGRRRVVFDIAEIDVKSPSAPTGRSSSGLLVVLDPSEFVHLAIEIISECVGKKSDLTATLVAFCKPWGTCTRTPPFASLLSRFELSTCT